MTNRFLCLFCCMLPVWLWSQSGRTDTVPFTLTEQDNLAISVRLNGKDSLVLMFHTAANAVTLIQDATRRLPDMQWADGGDVESWGGSQASRFSPVNSLEIGRMRWDSISIWENQHSGPGTDGKFGPDLFAGRVIQLDYDQGQLILSDELPTDLSGYQQVPLQNDRGLWFLPGTSQLGDSLIEHHFLIHTGYGGTVLFDDAFVAAHRLGQYVTITEEQTLKDAYGNAVVTKKGLLSTFRIGTRTLTDLPVGFFEGAIGRQQWSVLGAALLKRFQVIILSDRSAIFLRPSRYVNAAR
jgi:hypothetical protein